jgi:hypothetical protein
LLKPRVSSLDLSTLYHVLTRGRETEKAITLGQDLWSLSHYTKYDI